MKPRDPTTVTGAVVIIVDELGIDVCAEALGKSESLLRAWMDPDKPSLPSFDQAAILDSLYNVKTGRECPILRAYQNQITQATAPLIRRDLPTLVNNASAELGDVARMLAIILEDGMISHDEKCIFLKELADVDNATALIRLRVSQ